MIELNNVSKRFGTKEVLKHVSLTIPTNSIYGIKGRSGSGKTTILNIMGLIEKADEGFVNYEGEIIKTNKQIMNKLKYENSFIFQNFGLIDDETAFDNCSVIYPFRKFSKKQQQEQVETVLEKLGIKECIDKKVYELSGGEQQRVALAKAMLKKSKYIFADEPTASLDNENKWKVLNILKQFRSEGSTVILVSHDDEVLSICDHIFML